MNWVQVYRDDVIASIFGTPLTGFGRYSLAGLETASLELNAHLRVQPAHCVYDFYFSRIFRPCLTVDLTTLLCVTLSPPMIITLHLKFNCIKFVGPVDVRSLTHRQGG